LKYKNLIIDCNNLFWRSSINAIEHCIEIDSNPIYSIAIESAIIKLNELCKKFGYIDSNIYLLFDNPKSQINIRKIITNGQYKHSRELKNTPINFYKTLNVFVEILKSYSNHYFILRAESLEADDLTLPIRTFIKPEKNNECLFISADLDWARNIDDFCHWFNYYTLYTKEEFIKKYEFNPIGKTIQLWKALKGDNSDCVPNAIPYLPDTILKDILHKFKDIDDMYKKLWEQNYHEKWKIKLKEAEVQIRINFQTVDFIILEKDVTSVIFKCEENLKTVAFWYNVLKIPLESRMMKTKTATDIFFSKKKKERRYVI
jgi:hypothetical protein